MTVRELIHQINNAGWIVSGLYQADRRWHASIRKAKQMTSSYGIADDPEEALALAFARRGEDAFARREEDKKQSLKRIRF